MRTLRALTACVALGVAAGCGVAEVRDSPSGLSSPQQVLAADLDGDGRDDVVVHDGQEAALLRGEGEGALAAPAPLLAFTGVDRLSAVDFDGDGDLDLLLSTGQVYGNDGAGAFRQVEGTGLSARASALVDVDGDGALELIATTEDTGTLYRLDGAGFEHAGSLPVRAEALHPGDFDLDGDTDLLAVVRYNNILSSGSTAFLWLNDGAGSFTEAPVGLEDPYLIRVVDVDGDGADDVAWANGAQIVVSSGPDFDTQRARLDVSAGVTALLAVDDDGDGRQDLLAADRQRNDLSLHRADGNGGYRAERNAELDCAPSGLAAGAFGGGETPDWVTVDDCEGEVRLVLW